MSGKKYLKRRKNREVGGRNIFDLGSKIQTQNRNVMGRHLCSDFGPAYQNCLKVVFLLP
jgi:hypothetical protein